MEAANAKNWAVEPQEIFLCEIRVCQREIAGECTRNIVRMYIHILNYYKERSGK
jgi:hypothetical protein